ncbi:MAG: FAD-dependent oxidoreductase [Alphaproteobacteria bacterium]|nr:FAD-dependent oxidoreductase [Alphaproteobacteria bacterium]
MATPLKVTVVGAGVIGMCAAAQLQRQGHRVTVLDPDPPGSNCSFGNAGSISAHSCVPMSLPGIVWKVPRWLLDPLGPLAIRLGYLPTALPWLLRFVAAGRGDKVTAQARALRALYQPAVEAHYELAQDYGAEDLLMRAGTLQVYESEAGFAGDANVRRIMRANGVELNELDGHEIRQLEPALAPIFARGVHIEKSAHCIDPGGHVTRLAETFTRRGGHILARRVMGFETGTEGPSAIKTDAGDVPAGDKLVIAAGAWSHRLAAQLGSQVPLEAERGYHMTLASPGIETRRPISFADRKFMATPMAMGLRLAGTVEFAGIESEPNWRRSEVLVEHARRVFPGLDASHGSRWRGHRPATPDSVPVISGSPHLASVFYAFGHGHLGLTGGAITGRHIADLVSGRPTAIDMTPYRIDRF